MTTAAVHLLAPAGVHDPLRPSGGNTYDRRLSRAMGCGGLPVHLVEVDGSWPEAGPRGLEDLAGALAALPDGSPVLVDGLVASAAPPVLLPAARRLRVVVLLHMPLGLDSAARRPAESAVLHAAAAVVTTSAWTRSWLLAAYALDPGLVHVARPGVDAAPAGRGTPEGSTLLCVGAVTPGKGQDVLLAALARLHDLPWRCVCVGSEAVSAGYAAQVRRDARRHGLTDRFVLTGALVGDDLAGRYAHADVLVVPSRSETYGMVATEALARGLPVIASDVGGLPEAVGTAADGTVPGLLVAPGDITSLTAGLRRWLEDADLRAALRRAALRRRADLAGWPGTADRVARVVREAAA